MHRRHAVLAAAHSSTADGRLQALSAICEASPVAACGRAGGRPPRRDRRGTAQLLLHTEAPNPQQTLRPSRARARQERGGRGDQAAAAADVQERVAGLQV